MVKQIVHKSEIVKPGEHYGAHHKPYRRRAGKQPDATSTYEVDGVTHLFTGTCHEDCENVL